MTGMGCVTGVERQQVENGDLRSCAHILTSDECVTVGQVASQVVAGARVKGDTRRRSPTNCLWFAATLPTTRRRDASGNHSCDRALLHLAPETPRTAPSSDTGPRNSAAVTRHARPAAHALVAPSPGSSAQVALNRIVERAARAVPNPTRARWRRRHLSARPQPRPAACEFRAARPDRRGNADRPTDRPAHRRV